MRKRFATFYYTVNVHCRQHVWLWSRGPEMRFVIAPHQCIWPPSGISSSADQRFMLPTLPGFFTTFGLQAFNTLLIHCYVVPRPTLLIWNQDGWGIGVGIPRKMRFRFERVRGRCSLADFWPFDEKRFTLLLTVCNFPSSIFTRVNWAAGPIIDWCIICWHFAPFQATDNNDWRYRSRKRTLRIRQTLVETNYSEYRLRLFFGSVLE